MLATLYRIEAVDSIQGTQESCHPLNLAEMVEIAGRASLPLKALSMDLASGLDQIGTPCILHCRGNHYVVVLGRAGDRFLIADPSFGCYSLKSRELEWVANAGDGTIVGLWGKAVLVPRTVFLIGVFWRYIECGKALSECVLRLPRHSVGVIASASGEALAACAVVLPFAGVGGGAMLLGLVVSICLAFCSALIIEAGGGAGGVAMRPWLSLLRAGTKWLILSAAMVMIGWLFSVTVMLVILGTSISTSALRQRLGALTLISSFLKSRASEECQACRSRQTTTACLVDVLEAFGGQSAILLIVASCLFIGLRRNDSVGSIASAACMGLVAYAAFALAVLEARVGLTYRFKKRRGATGARPA